MNCEQMKLKANTLTIYEAVAPSPAGEGVGDEASNPMKD